VAATNLDRVVKDLNQMIAYKKGIDENKQEIQFEDVVKIIRKNLEKQIQTSEAIIITDFTKAPSIYSVFNYVLSIFTNLIENALKYRSLKRSPVIKLESHSESGFTCVKICDNGLGINLEMQKEKIFGLYKRFHTHVEGKGIGLHLVKTQLESLGGKIDVVSKPDSGTCFILFFKNLQ
jgi:signal transduction histidine kinase